MKTGVIFLLTTEIPQTGFRKFSGGGLSLRPAALFFGYGTSVSGGHSRRLCRFQLCQFPFHLNDQHRQFFLALLAGMGVDVAGVLFAVDPLGRVAALPQVVIDLADAARPWPAVGRAVGGELYWRNSFLPLCFILLLHLHPGDALVNIPSCVPLHLAGDVGVDVQRGSGGDMSNDGGQGLYIHPILQGHGGKGVPLWHNKDKSENPCGARSWRFVLILFPLKTALK